MSNIYLIVHSPTNHTRLINPSSAISPHTVDRRKWDTQNMKIRSRQLFDLQILRFD